MSIREKAERALLSDGWTCKEIKYSAFGHKTRLGWSHPSGVYKRPVSFEKAYKFYFMYHMYFDWYL